MFNFLKRKKKLAIAEPPETWAEAEKLLMPVLSTSESVQEFLKVNQGDPHTSDSWGAVVTERLDFLISYVIDLGDGILPVTEKFAQSLGVNIRTYPFAQRAHDNLVQYINEKKTIKYESAGDSLAFINTTPNPEDEYVASIAAFPELLGQYVGKLTQEEVFIVFPNRYSISIMNPGLKLLAEKAIADFYPSVHPRKRVSKSIYRFKVGGDLSIEETLTDERIQEILARGC